jgi:glycosyltransferase involved in cell wall biosynthesis
MSRLAWFSPLPPVKSGISQYNFELLAPLARRLDFDLFMDGKPEAFVAPCSGVKLFSAYDFLWKHRERPYDLCVYQLGNAPCHDYLWAYLIRVPGMVVLHDGQLHHARGRMLLQQRHPRRDDYRREFRFNHPDADPDLAELGAVGLLGSLTYFWPMLRSVIECSRCVLVHNHWLAEEIREAHPGARLEVVEMGVPTSIPRDDARRRIRARHTIPETAVVFTAIGKITPEKRLREALRALESVSNTVPHAHVVMAGETVDYYDLEAEAAALGVRDRVTFTGYVADDEISDYLAASDVCLCMRWPTSRETSASWLRCLAAGKPTITTDLVHTVDIPMLDPRNWSVLAGQSEVTRHEPATEPQPVGVSVDILDEGHSLKLAIRRLATDDKLRLTLGSNARRLWAERYQLDRMVTGYERVIAQLVQEAPRRIDALETLPLHLRATGQEHGESLIREIAGPEYHLRDVD